LDAREPITHYKAAFAMGALSAAAKAVHKVKLARSCCNFLKTPDCMLIVLDIMYILFYYMYIKHYYK